MNAASTSRVPKVLSDAFFQVQSSVELHLQKLTPSPASFLVRDVDAIWFRLDKAKLLFETGLDNCPDNPFLLQAFAVMEEERGNAAKVLRSAVVCSL